MSLRRWYICDVNPVPWRVGPVGAVRNAKSGKMKGYVGRDQELATYQEALRDSLRRQHPVLIDGPFTMTIYFWRNMTDHVTSGKKTQSNIADATNLYKAAEDACQKILFPNDRANVDGRQVIVEQGPDTEGRVVICIERATTQHMFGIRTEFPDEIFSELFGSNGEQLRLAVDIPRTELSPDDSRYANAPDDF